MWPFGGGGGGGGARPSPEATEELLIRDDYEPSSSAGSPASPSADAWGAPAADDSATKPFELAPPLDADADAAETDALTGRVLSDGERRRKIALSAAEEETPSSKPRAAAYAFAALNVITSCAAVAIAKQMLNPDNLRAGGAGAAASAPNATPPPAPPASAAVPPWFRDTYTQWAAGEAGRAAVRRVAKDTAVLAGASAVWYGAEWGLRAARGGKDDAFNPAVAGGLGAGLIGLAFFGDAAAAVASASSSAAVREAMRRRVLLRSGLWAGAGAALGAWGWQEAQRARGAMLRRQQELERKHLGTKEDEVAGALDGRLLRLLARMEEAERQKQRQAAAAAAAAARGGDGGGIEGSAAEAGLPALGPPPPGGYTREEEERRWRQLMDNPPWVQQQPRAGGGEGGGVGGVGGGVSGGGGGIGGNDDPRR